MVTCEDRYCATHLARPLLWWSIGLAMLRDVLLTSIGGGDVREDFEAGACEEGELAHRLTCDSVREMFSVTCMWSQLRHHLTVQSVRLTKTRSYCLVDKDGIVNVEQMEIRGKTNSVYSTDLLEPMFLRNEGETNM